MKNRLVFMIVILAVLLAACATKLAATPQALLGVRQSAGAQANENLPSPALPAPSVISKVAGASDTTSLNTTNTNSAPFHNRMVMTSIDLNVVVADPRVKLDAIAQIATSLGGWVVSENMYQATTQGGTLAPEGTISIRVPSDKLDSALGQIKAGVVEVRSETRNGQDVTSQYTDLQSQLNNLEQAETDLQQIMDEAKNNPNSNTTSKTQDVLSVYNQIVSVRGQIEQIKGQMQYYQESSDTSLINTTLIAEATIKPISIGGWKPQGVARNAVQALVTFLQGFVNFIIYFALLVLPVLILTLGPVVLIIWGILSLVRRRRIKKAPGTK